MSRPRTAPGTYGRITVVGQVQSGDRWLTAPAGTKPVRWRARARYRDADGVLRDVERFGRTKSKSETELRAALVNRQAPTKGRVLRTDTAMRDAAALWLEQAQRPDSGLSTSTVKVYAGTVKRHVQGGAIAGLSLREANSVPVLRGFLQDVADANGPGTAKTVRSVVSAILKLAVNDGVLAFNAMRDVSAPKVSKAKAAEIRDIRRAFTRVERDAVLAFADTHERSIALDTTDVIWFLAGTGVRISEALDLPWDGVDLDKGTAAIGGTKTTGSRRTLHLPSWLVERLRERARVQGTGGLVFANPWRVGTTDETRSGRQRRDVRNISRVVREVLTEAGHPWASSHSFRRTVASLIDEAGLPIALAADVLGHSDPSMTARVYLGRRGGTAAAAGVL